FSNILLFHFTDANPKGPLGDFSAVITWGDGTSNTVTAVPSAAGRIVVHSGGGFDVLGSHVYADSLSNATFSVQVTDKGGSSTGSSTSTFSVAEAIPVATLGGLSGGKVGQPLTFT